MTWWAWAGGWQRGRSPGRSSRLLLAGMVFLALHDPDPARQASPRPTSPSNSSYTVGLLACWLVGVLLTLRVPDAAPAGRSWRSAP